MYHSHFNEFQIEYQSKHAVLGATILVAIIPTNQPLKEILHLTFYAANLCGFFFFFFQFSTLGVSACATVFLLDSTNISAAVYSRYKRPMFNSYLERQHSSPVH